MAIHPLQHVFAAIRMLASGLATDALDEYPQMSENSFRVFFKSFFRAVAKLFGSEYLREYNEDDLKRLMSINAAKGFQNVWATSTAKIRF